MVSVRASDHPMHEMEEIVASERLGQDRRVTALEGGVSPYLVAREADDARASFRCASGRAPCVRCLARSRARDVPARKSSKNGWGGGGAGPPPPPPPPVDVLIRVASVRTSAR